LTSSGIIPLLVICGPTASGKTRLAVELGADLPIEIVSADSRQVYRWMNIGTAKATTDERDQVPHHLLDVVDPDESFTAADFMRLGREAIGRIHSRKRLPVVVGGTGLYITALIHGLVDAPSSNVQLRQALLETEEREGEGTLHRKLCLIDPESARLIAPQDRIRVVRALEVYQLTGERLSSMQKSHALGSQQHYRVLYVGVTADREMLYQRINQRTEAIFSGGIQQETECLLRRGFHPQLKAMQTIGYRECIRAQQGDIPWAEALAQTQQETRRYAKRQLTWFKKNNSIIWVDSVREFDKIRKSAERFYAV